MTSDANNSSIFPGDLDFLSYVSSILPTKRKISAAIDERPNLRAELELFDPLTSAALVAGLLTEPSLQANTLRIELLIHLLLAFAVGNRNAGRPEIVRWIDSELGTTVFALMEDPPEDVFVSNVITPNGNFRIFEGTWESSDFYLQTILNVVETLPDNNASRQLRREVLAILKVSEKVAARRGLARFSPGSGGGENDIPSVDK
jgi:hypothetical protein